MSWNGSNNVGAASCRTNRARQDASPTKRSARRGILTGLLIVIALGGAAVWWFAGRGRPQGGQQVAKHKASSTIAEVRPQIITNKSDCIQKEKEYVPYWMLDKCPEGLPKGMQRRWKHYHNPPPCYTNMTATTDPPEDYEIFSHPVENRIAFYLTLQPGSSLVGAPIFSNQLDNDFLESCKEPIIVSENDTSKDMALKRSMSEAKIEIANRLRAGEHLADILTEAHYELQKLSYTKQQIDQMVRDESLHIENEADLDSLFDAANKILEDKGIAPISPNPIVRRNLKQRLQKNKSQSIL